MKKIVLLLLVTVCLLNGCHSNSSSLNANSTSSAPGTDTVKIHTVTPQPADTTIKDGQVVKRYPNGIIEEKSYYVAGRRQGECQSFFPNGKLRSDDFFTNGLLDGATTVYYDNGQKEYEGACTEGKPSGIWKFYDKTGKLLRSVDYSKKKGNLVM